MEDVRTYPATITPVQAVTSRRDRTGRPFLSFRAEAHASGRRSTRTVRVFGENVSIMRASLRPGVPVKARVAYDSFTGADGRHSQTMRIVSLDD